MNRRITSAVCLASVLLSAAISPANDLGRIALWNGESSAAGDLGNYWGGTVVHLGGTKCEVTRTTDRHAGSFGYDIRFTQPVSDFAFFMLTASGFGPSANYVMTRDLTQYRRLEFWLKNPGVPCSLKIELKDYADSTAQSQSYVLAIAGNTGWTKYSIPLTGAGWQVAGQPDLQRLRFLGFVFQPGGGVPLTGSVQMDDVELIEISAPIEINSAPLDTLINRHLRRVFLALYGARSRDHHLIPMNSFYGDIAALNSTAGVVNLLPTAVSRAWISRAEADAYVDQLLTTIETLRNGRRLPPRYVDWVTLQPAFAKEESPVDAALMALALYKYSSVPETPVALRNRIRSVVGAFDFAPFATASGWSLAYDITSGQMSNQTYSSYSSEVFIISLAAHLSGDVDIAQLFHSGTLRVKAHLVNPANRHLVATDNRFRAPFLQWMWPLLVKLDGLPVDTYPDPDFRVNPLDNARLYQAEVLAKLTTLGRANLIQPDAGDDGAGQYEQYSLYNNFGAPDLLMPWSAANVLMLDPHRAGTAIRNSLSKFNGPFGVPDVIRQQGNSLTPALIVSRQDFWNCSLGAWAMALYLDPRSNAYLANDPTVRMALNRMYPRIAPGDYVRHAIIDPETVGTEIATRFIQMLPIPPLEEN